MIFTEMFTDIQRFRFPAKKSAFIRPIRVIRVLSYTASIQTNFLPLFLLFVAITVVSCGSNHGNDFKKEEQLRVDTEERMMDVDSAMNSIRGNIRNKIATRPNAVILTGMNAHRLVTVYKERAVGSGENNRYWNDSDGDESEREEHFMPGIDILYGWNLLNIAHYDFKTEKMNFLFPQPVLIKTLYYPAFEQDSLDMKPVNRNYYLVSVYDEDTNHDTLINKKDLRRFYLFDSTATQKTALLPVNYTVVRSQYDSKNDVMYIYARRDENKNGTGDKSEPVNIFWIDLTKPGKAKQLY